MMNEVFANLILADWRQFRGVHVDFHPNMTIITGANGSGKTTILNLLSRHFGWWLQVVEIGGLTRAVASLPEADSGFEAETIAEILKTLSESQLTSPAPQAGWTREASRTNSTIRRGI